MIKRTLFILIISFSSLLVYAQEAYYEQAYSHIENMLTDKVELNMQAKMLIKKLLGCIMCILFVSCNSNNNKDVYDGILEPRENIKTILDSFVQVKNDKSLIYELYIDKVTPEEHHLFLYAGKVSLLNHKNKVSQTEISGVKIDIYSGLEHYFKNANDTSPFNDTFSDPLPEGYFWIIKDSCGVVNIYQEDWIHPFYNLPNMLGVPDSILYLPPDIN